MCGVLHYLGRLLWQQGKMAFRNPAIRTAMLFCWMLFGATPLFGYVHYTLHSEGHVAVQQGEIDAAIKRLELSSKRLEEEYRDRRDRMEKDYNFRCDQLEKLASRDYDWLTNKINLLGILLGVAALLGIGLPLWSVGRMIKVMCDIKKARQGTVLASKIANAARDHTQKAIRDQALMFARNCHEMSKSNYYLYHSLVGKVANQMPPWNKQPNILPATIESLLEMRRNHMVQALMCMNQAIVYNVSAQAEQPLIRNISQMKVYLGALNVDTDANNIASKISNFEWSYSGDDLEKILAKVMCPKVGQLLNDYKAITAKYGKIV